VDSLLGRVLEGSGLIDFQFGQYSLLQHSHRFLIKTLNEAGPPIESRPLRSTQDCRCKQKVHQ